MDRAKIMVWWIVAEVWQFFFGAFTSLQLGAPGVGERASWVPNLLVDEAFAILPVVFLLCLWGAPIGRAIAALGAGVLIVVALAGSATLARSPSELLVFFALLAPPWLALLASIRQAGRTSDAVAGR
jgi:hypothetical protein